MSRLLLWSVRAWAVYTQRSGSRSVYSNRAVQPVARPIRLRWLLLCHGRNMPCICPFWLRSLWRYICPMLSCRSRISCLNTVPVTHTVLEFYNHRYPGQRCDGSVSLFGRCDSRDNAPSPLIPRSFHQPCLSCSPKGHCCRSVCICWRSHPASNNKVNCGIFGDAYVL